MPEFAGTNILIIDDDQTSVAVLRSLLLTLGAEAGAIIDVHDIQNDLQSLAERPDAIFLDLEMPFTNGYEILTMIHADPYFDGVPVVAYTTHLSHMNEARDAGFHSYLGKPIDKRAFPGQLADILHGQPVWSAR